jgi:hypothetical protein
MRGACERDGLALSAGCLVGSSLGSSNVANSRWGSMNVDIKGGEEASAVTKSSEGSSVKKWALLLSSVRSTSTACLRRSLGGTARRSLGLVGEKVGLVGE